MAYRVGSPVPHGHASQHDLQWPRSGPGDMDTAGWYTKLRFSLELPGHLRRETMAGDRGQLGQLVQAHASPTLEVSPFPEEPREAWLRVVASVRAPGRSRSRSGGHRALGYFLPREGRTATPGECELVVPVHGCACQLLPVLLPDQPPLGSGPSRPACSFAPPPGAGSAARPLVFRAEAKGAAPSGPSPSAQPMLR